MTNLIRNICGVEGRPNSYFVGGNVCNAFFLGEVGSMTDFFLIAAEPDEEASYPLLTGNILDSEGHVLFKLVRNILVINPGNCSKVLSNHIGYEIHDSAGVPILKVSTTFREPPMAPQGTDKSFITTIEANFYNANCGASFVANTDGPKEGIIAKCKSGFGFNGTGFGMCSGASEEELQFAATVLAARGFVHQKLTGQHHDEDIILDGKALINAHLTKCRISIATGDFIMRNSSITHCLFNFTGSAQRVLCCYDSTFTAAKPPESNPTPT